MRFWKKLNKATAAFFVFLALFSGPAVADSIDVQNIVLEPAEDGYALSANLEFELNPRLEEAINKGVALHFVTEFELNRSRWYWLDENTARTSQSIRLSYHALTRQYRLSSGALYQSFPTLREAMRTIKGIRSWHVAEKGSVKPDQTYQAALRVYLDLNQLPKPFQVSALTSRDWTLNSGWKRWIFSVPEAERGTEKVR